MTNQEPQVWCPGGCGSDLRDWDNAHLEIMENGETWCVVCASGQRVEYEVVLSPTELERQATLDDISRAAIAKATGEDVTS